MKTAILLLSTLMFAGAAGAATKMPIPAAKVDVPVALQRGNRLPYSRAAVFGEHRLSLSA